MRIHSVRTHNFRGFEDETFNLNPTVAAKRSSAFWIAIDMKNCNCRWAKL